MIRFTQDNAVIVNESFRAILAGLQVNEDIDRSMEELELLAEAAGADVAGIMVQTKAAPERATYFGAGKTEELRDFCLKMEADTVICNNELSGIQIRNLEEIIGVRIIDRTILILDIFAGRASSKEGKLQVELAQLQYRLPRMTGFGKALSRLGGGIGTRGPGEKKLETDRRHIARRMDEIKGELKKISAQRGVMKAKRKKNQIPVVALVGYTNSGKSAIMNCLLKMIDQEDKSVIERDMLFSTLDTYQRKIKLEDNKEFILEDTVGFVSKLPHSLIQAFKATLEDVSEADLLLHIIDSSYEDSAFHMMVVDDVLSELGAAGKDTIRVFNKIDLLNDIESAGITNLENDSIAVSAKRGDYMNLLLEQIKKKLFSGDRAAELLIPFEKGDLVSYLCEHTHILTREYRENGVYIKANLAPMDYGRLAEYLIE